MSRFIQLLISRVLLVLLVEILPANRSGPAYAQTAGTQTNGQETTTSTPPELSPADVINTVNNLRLSNGLNALAAHPVLMQVAAQQASALALSEGAIGHQRPCGMTLGQQLLVLGYPLWGDLSLDGYRSENWGVASGTEGIISAWLGDEEHANTMLSPDRSDIGAAVAISNQIYIVLETALKTNSGQHQSTAHDILTGIPLTQTVCAGYTTGDISQYSVPISISTAKPDEDVIHQVQYGQTLWSIAVQYHTTIAEIKRLNALTDNTISSGWKLLVRKGATQPVPMTDTPLVMVTPTETKYPTAIPYYTPTPTFTATITTIPLGQQIRLNSTAVDLLLGFAGRDHWVWEEEGVKQNLKILIFLFPIIFVTGCTGNPQTEVLPRDVDENLPVGVVNGEIVFGDNLYWFIWENSRHRIWMPGTLDESFQDSYKSGSDSTGKLVGDPNPNPVQAIFLPADPSQMNKVYLVDKYTKTIYPVQVRILDTAILDEIPISTVSQYFPVMK